MVLVDTALSWKVYQHTDGSGRCKVHGCVQLGCGYSTLVLSKNVMDYSMVNLWVSVDN